MSSSPAAVSASPANSSCHEALSFALGSKLVMTALFWGGTFIAGRVLAQSLSPIAAAWCRFLVAGVLLLVVARCIEGGLPRLNRAQLLVTAALGFTGILLYNICFFGALTRIPAGRTALFVSLTPIVTALAASVIFRERLGRRRWAGIAIALLGTLVVITRGDLTGAVRHMGGSFGVGESLMLAAVLCWSAYTLISRQVASSLSPIAVTTYATLWGLGFLSLCAIGDIASTQWAALDWTVWMSILYLGALGTVVAFVWYSEGIQAVGPSRTAVFTNLVPAFGVLLSAVILGEEVLPSMLVGGALAGIGVSLANRKQ